MTARAQGAKPSKISVIIAILIGLGTAFGFFKSDADEPRAATESPTSSTNSATTATLEGTIPQLFEDKRSETMVEFTGTVERVLADDNDGSRHQRFLVGVEGGITVLIAHNIDLAPRVPLERDDRVKIYGQYEWNEKGGVVHWTHHDPGGWHAEGWIEHEGKKYE